VHANGLVVGEGGVEWGTGQMGLDLVGGVGLVRPLPYSALRLE
jgi:hypothetical protein